MALEHQWYVVHVYSGFERKVRSELMERIRLGGHSDLFSDVLVPSEEVVELRKGQKVVSDRKFFPGYVLVKMVMNDETWHLVKNTPKVSGFLGAGSRPQVLSQKEVDVILHQLEEGLERPRPKVTFSVGEPVRVVDGPFNSFNGLIEEVDAEKTRIKVSVSIFGRATPVELDYVQVEKV